MATAKQGDTVTVHYTGKLDDGTVFDSSEGREPLEFTIGAHEVLRGVEDAVVGLAVGERTTVTIAPGDGYGERNEEKVVDVPRGEFPPHIDPRPGMVVQSTLPQGNIVLTIVEVTEHRVTLDANHPLAGQQLTFDLELTGIA